MCHPVMRGCAEANRLLHTDDDRRQRRKARCGNECHAQRDQVSRTVLHKMRSDDRDEHAPGSDFHYGNRTLA